MKKDLMYCETCGIDVHELNVPIFEKPLRIALRSDVQWLEQNTGDNRHQENICLDCFTKEALSISKNFKTRLSIAQTSANQENQAKDVKVNDYILGYEYYGHDIKEIKGWVDKVVYREDGLLFNIQCDDSYEGARGSLIYEKLGSVRILSDKERPL